MREGFLRRLPPGVRAVFSPAPALKDARSLVLVKCDNIGDFILATTFLNTAYERWKDRAVTLVCSPAVSELAAILYPSWKRRMVAPPWVAPAGRFVRGSDLEREVRAWSCADWLISLRPIRFHEEVRLDGWIGARRKLALVNQASGPSASSAKAERRTYDEWVAEPACADPQECRDIAGHRALLERCFPGEASNAGALPSLAGRLDPTGARWFACSARAGLHPARRYLAVCPFPSQDIRRYPLDRLARAVEAICGRHGLDAVILGGPADGAKGADFAAKLSVPGGTTTLAGKLSLVDSALVLQHAAGTLGVETWSAHGAIASGVPSVVILGGGHAGQFGPWGPPALASWVTHPLPCYNCGWSCTQQRPVCIEDIPVEAVTAAWERLSPRAA